jgi:hypothetical protein
MTGEEDRSVITQPEAVPLIHVPMLEPSEASQKVRNIDTFRGANAPGCGVSCEGFSKAGLFIGTPLPENSQPDVFQKIIQRRPSELPYRDLLPVQLLFIDHWLNIASFIQNEFLHFFDASRKHPSE